MPKRIQRQRTRGWRTPECSCGCGQPARYVGRPTKWGNPWQVGPAMSPAGAVWRYNDAALGRLGKFSYGVPDVATIRAELRGHDLACWCPLDQPCHADVLLELANPCPDCTCPEHDAPRHCPEHGPPQAHPMDVCAHGQED